MHVCGTHEHTLSKYELRPLLPKEIEILSDLGCSVCVCLATDIDKTIELGKREDTIITTFGDKIKPTAIGKDAAIIGEDEADNPKRVLLSILVGGTRFVDMPLGKAMPRIC